MAGKSAKHLYEQIGIGTLTLGLTFLSAAYLPILAPFCFSIGIAGIIWHDMRRGTVRLEKAVSKITSLETTAQKLQRENSILREDLETLSLRTSPKTPAKRTPAEEERISEEAAKFEKIIQNIKIDPAPAGLSAKPIRQNNMAAGLSDTVIRELLVHAIENDRIELFAQPILRLPQRKPAFYELFTRLRAGAGNMVSADRYLMMAQKENLLPALDNVLLLHTLKILREQESQGTHTAHGFFLNVSSATLSDTKFVSDLLAFIERHPTLAPRLVFEFSALQVPDLGARPQKVIAGLAKLGCRFSLDHLTADRFSPSVLNLAPFAFMKMDVQSVLREIVKPVGLSRIRNLKDQLEHHAVSLIFDRIEREDDVLEVLDFDVNYGQGHLFAEAQPYLSLIDPKTQRKSA
ncbi:MAG: EAL domain-containing protein [Alphaproteobacteria bacterium]|nr:EAL domain-containing protein [Alphaproteobacteria bacterium]